MSIQPNLLALSDALSLLERIDNDSVDLVYLDPPGLINPEAQNDGQERDDYFDFIYKVLQQAFRVLKNTGSVCLFSNYEFGVDFHLLLRKLFGSTNRRLDFIIPRRASHSSLSLRTSAVYDTMIMYGKELFIPNTRIKKLTKEEIFKLFPYTSDEKVYRRVSLFASHINRQNRNLSWNGYIPPKGQSWRYPHERLDELLASGYIDESNGIPSLMQFATADDFVSDIDVYWADLPRFYKREYLSQQPVELLERVLQVGSQLGGTVVDPFCGAGTMPVACLKLGRQFIASDISGEAFRISMEKIELANTLKHLPSFIDESQLDQFPILWDNYLKVSPTEEDAIIKMIEAGEGNSIEFKESLVWNYVTNSKKAKDTDVLKAIAAFTNTEGGAIIIGVKNDKSFVDLSLDYKVADPQKKDRDGYELYINNRVKNGLEPIPISGYSVKFFTINECEICLINVKRLDVPTFLNGEFYVRNNNQSILLDNKNFYDYLNTRFIK